MIKEITSGVFGSLVDIILWQIFLVGASIGKSGPRGISQAFREADEMLEKINHNTLSSTLHQISKKGYVVYKKRDGLYNFEISEFGKKRLSQNMPTYLVKRPWDQKIYIISYDIPEESHKKRDIFRNFLKRINCKLLQESVWLTPYNPRQLINELIKDKKIPGTIIVSDVGKDGGIGETRLGDLLVSLYSLGEINDRYEIFLNKAKVKKKYAKLMLIEYLSILQDDPQLPFEVLPSWW